MKDIDLETLSQIKAPKPAKNAREQAVVSSLEAFDQVRAEKKSSSTQGLGDGDRQTSILTPVWRSIMKSVVKPFWEMKPATIAAATGVLVLPIAGVLAWNVLEPTSSDFTSQETVSLDGKPQKPAQNLLILIRDFVVVENLARVTRRSLLVVHYCHIVYLRSHP